MKRFLAHKHSFVEAVQSPGGKAERAKDGVSICIPCFNSSSRLPETLRHLQRQQTPPGLRWEVILIDNASADNTAEVAESLWANCSTAPLRVVREVKAGLTFARVRAFAESAYEYVVFVDDDNWICEHWVATVYEILQNHPDVAACGGCGEPTFANDRIPEWFPRWKHFYAVGPQAENDGYVPLSKGQLYGAGLSLRRSAWFGLQSKGFRCLLSDRLGDNLATGGDTEICLALQLAGWRLWYDSRLEFKHFIPPERLSEKYMIRRMEGNGEADVWLDIYWALLRPSRKRFRRLPFSPERAQQIRESWLFHFCISLRSAFLGLQKLLEGRNRRDLNTISQWAVAVGRLRSLRFGPLRYRAFKRKLSRAKWLECNEVELR